MKKAALLVIIFLGLSLRVIGSDWGFPFLLHPDEPVVADVPFDMAKRASLDPGEYNHPDHFGIYANAVMYHAASYIVYQRPLTETFNAHKLLFYRISRIFIALLGTACIVAAYLIGKEFSTNTGPIAALLVAIFPSYVDHSHYITADIPLTLFMLSVILFVIRYMKDPTDRNLLAASCFLALSVSEKYPGGLGLLLILSAIVYKTRGEKTTRRSIFKALAGFLVSLFIVSPYLIINFHEAVMAVFTNAYPVHLGADGLGWPGNMAFYATSYLKFSGVIMLLFFFLGTLSVIRKKETYAAPVFFGLLYWVVLSKVGLHWERWALPMYTCPLIVSAHGIAVAHEKAAQLSRRHLVPLWCVAFVLIIGKLLLASSVVTAQFTLQDTRFASYLFARKTGIPEENTLYEGFTPFYPSNMRNGSVLNAYNTLDKNKSIRYVIVSSDLYDRYLGEGDRFQAEAEFYRRVFSLPLVRTFAPRAYFPEESSPFYLANDPARGLAFLMDYARDREQLFTGPSIQIYRYASPGFLDR